MQTWGRISVPNAQSGPSLAQSLMPSTLAVAFINSTFSDANSSTYTFTGIFSGFSFATNRAAVLTVHSGGLGARPSSIVAKSGGFPTGLFVMVASIESSNQSESVWIHRNLPINSSSITIDSTGIAGRMYVGFYSIYAGGAEFELTPTEFSFTTSTNSASTTINISSGGAVIGQAALITGAGQVTWTGLTENFDMAMEGTQRYTGAYYPSTSTVTSTSLAITLTTTSTNGSYFNVLVASWAP